MSNCAANGCPLGGTRSAELRNRRAPETVWVCYKHGKQIDDITCGFGNCKAKPVSLGRCERHRGRTKPSSAQVAPPRRQVARKIPTPAPKKKEPTVAKKTPAVKKILGGEREAEKSAKREAHLLQILIDAYPLELSSSSIAARADLGQSTVSRHLVVMEERGEAVRTGATRSTKWLVGVKHRPAATRPGVQDLVTAGILGGAAKGLEETYPDSKRPEPAEPTEHRNDRKRRLETLKTLRAKLEATMAQDQARVIAARGAIKEVSSEIDALRLDT